MLFKVLVHTIYTLRYTCHAYLFISGSKSSERAVDGGEDDGDKTLAEYPDDEIVTISGRCVPSLECCSAVCDKLQAVCFFHFYVVSIALLYVCRKQSEAQAQEGELQRAQLQ